MSNKGLKKAALVGAVLGALFSLGIAISLDYLLADSLQGTWRDAAAKDVAKIFGPGCGGNWLAVTIVLIITMGFLAGVGAFFGTIAAMILHRFFRLLLK